MTTINPCLALLIGNDIVAHAILNRLVPTMCAAGIEPILYLPEHFASRKPEARHVELLRFGFAERGLANEIVYPFLARHDGAAPQLMLSPEQLAKRYGLGLERVRNINDPAFVGQLAELSGLVGGISIRCFQIFRTPLIEVLRQKGVLLNLHPGLLPRHRGVLSTAWAMASGDADLGCALHHIDEGVDTGNILWCDRRPFDRNRSVFANNLDHMVACGTETLLRVLPYIKAGLVPAGHVQPLSASNGAAYHSFPTATELAQWHECGVVLVHDAEIPLLLSAKFYDASTPQGQVLAADLRTRIRRALDEHALTLASGPAAIGAPPLLGALGRANP
jgi:hypothetical protein